MALLDRSDWYDIARDTNWTPDYVPREDLFPPELSDPYNIPVEEWETFDEPYKVSYREYVKIQREKDSSAYSVKAALSRSKFHDQVDEGWASVLKLHYGAVALTEYQACQFQARMVRFGPSPSMRNMATYGMLDELRHAQLQLFFPHELLPRDRQYDWAHEAAHTKNWAVLGGRHAIDDIMMCRDAVTGAVMVSFAFETGLTNLQMVGLSTDAANMGDFTFANLITSIQSDEARHAQLGSPAIEIMIKNGRKKEAQLAVDVAFWRMWRLFAITVGIPMDYYIPLEQRHMSFKEFMHEWIIRQYDRQVRDLGLETPWYWDLLVDDIENHHHCQHGGIWSWRPTVWWNPPGAVGPRERQWLEDKYPGWNDSYGTYWDVITDNLLHGREEKTHPECIPIICNMCQIPISNRPGKSWKARALQLEHEGRRYNFCTEPCRWIFTTDPERYKHHLSIVDRMYSGEIDPNTLDNVLIYMGIGVVSEGGRDGHDYRWVDGFRAQAAE
jgi:toluene monooxygenase system protein A